MYILSVSNLNQNVQNYNQTGKNLPNDVFYKGYFKMQQN